MKRFILSPSVLVWLVLLGSVTIILLVPPVKMAFGHWIWDRFVIPFYEESRIFRFRLIVYAFVVFILAAFLFSRSPWWRFAMNAMTLDLMERMVQYPIVPRAYQVWRHWYAVWFPLTRFNFLDRIPLVQSSEYRQHKSPPGYLPPNRRFLALLRSHLDFYSDQLVISLSEQRSKGNTNVPEAFWEQLSLDMRRERHCWYGHVLLERPNHRLVPEPVFGSTMIALEHWTLAKAFQCFLGQPFPRQEELEAEVEERLSELNSLPACSGGFGSAAQQNYDAANHLEPVSNKLMTLLSAYHAMCLGAIGLGKIPEGVWAKGLVHRLTTLTMERLVACGYDQEAVQVYYHSQAIISFLEEIFSRNKAEAESEPRLLKILFINLFQDIAAPDEDWHVLLASPTRDPWQQMLLAEAWGGITSSLLQAFPNGKEHLILPESKLSLYGGEERLTRARMWAIRRGYLTYARDETIAAANASLNLSNYRGLINRNRSTRCAIR